MHVTENLQKQIDICEIILKQSGGVHYKKRNKIYVTENTGNTV